MVPCSVTKAVPLPPIIVAGVMVQVVVPSDDGTLQVRVISELNPPTEVTVRLSVIVPPLGMDTTGLATVRVKSGAVTAYSSERDRLPLVVKTRTSKPPEEPGVAEDEAVKVRVELTELFCGSRTEAGVIEQVSCAGRPPQVGDKVSAKPFELAIVTVCDTEVPGAMLIDWLVVLSVKSP